MAKTILLNYGIFTPQPETSIRVNDENSPKGYFILSKEADLVKRTENIPLQHWLSFGLQYKIECSETEFISYKIRILHPEMENPDTGYTFLQTILHRSVPAGEIVFDLFTFEYKWELLPGFWTFQILMNEKILLEKEFNTYFEPTFEEAEENYFYDM